MVRWNVQRGFCKGLAGSALKKHLVNAQALLPQHAITNVVNWLARIETPWFKNAFIKSAMGLLSIDLTDAQRKTPEEYASFNDFFTRELAPGARTIAPAPSIASPVDGRISAIGYLDDNMLLQAKDKYFSLQSLLAGHQLFSEHFRGGAFATIYLAPYDYHRIHTPVAGRLLEMHSVPGRLFSVNEASVRYIDRLFARNERVCSFFEASLGTFALVKVGALNVGSIETLWSGVVTPSKRIRRECYDQGPTFQQGEEVARFNFGSTVILVFPENTVEWDPQLGPGDKVTLGQPLGQTLPSPG